MTAITTWTEVQRYAVLRNVVAQATTGQTDWVRVPNWARYVVFDFNLTAVAGSTPSVTAFGVRAYDFTRRDDNVANADNVALAAQGPSASLTAAGRILWQAGPGLTGIANDGTNAGTGLSNISVNCTLPPVIGWRCTFDRADGNETYTYSLSVAFS